MPPRGAIEAARCHPAGGSQAGRQRLAAPCGFDKPGSDAEQECVSDAALPCGKKVSIKLDILTKEQIQELEDQGEDPSQYDFSSEQIDKIVYNKDTNAVRKSLTAFTAATTIAIAAVATPSTADARWRG